MPKIPNLLSNEEVVRVRMSRCGCQQMTRYGKTGSHNYFLMAVRPEEFAFDIFILLMSFVAANLLWVYTVAICILVDTPDISTITQLVVILLVHTTVTTLLWWCVHEGRGLSVMQHLTLHVWNASKVIVLVVQSIYFFGIFDQITFKNQNETMQNFNILSVACGLFLVFVIECYRLVLFFRYIRRKTKRQVTKPKVNPSVLITV